MEPYAGAIYLNTKSLGVPSSLQRNSCKGNNFSGVVPKMGLKIVASGSTTADTYPATPQLEVTGAGILYFAGTLTADNDSKTVYCKVEVDGVVLGDDSNGVATSGDDGLFVVGWVEGGTVSFVCPECISFNESLKIYTTTSLTEINGSNIYYAYRAV